MIFIDAQRMAELADYTEIVDWLEEEHRGTIDALDDLLMTQPAAVAGITDTLLVRAAWQRGKTIGVKLITIFPENTKGTLPSIQAVYTLFDATNGTPLGNVDGTELTYWKTAADSALGAKLLARHDCESMVMIGAGAQAPYLIRAHCAVRPSIKRVVIWNRTHAKAEALAARNLIEGVTFEATEDIEDATRNGDLVCTATGSEEVLIYGDWIKTGAHVDLVGSYRPEMVETDVETFLRGRVFVDAYETTIGVCGDLLHPINAGTYQADAIEADLFTLCRQGMSTPRKPEDITVFKNGGGGHLDLMTASYFIEKAS